MFVKVVKYQMEDNKVFGTVDTTYQCGSARFRNVERKTGSGIMDLLVIMEGVPSQGTIEVQCEKEKLSVFLMNDNGKTIDSYIYK